MRISNGIQNRNRRMRNRMYGGVRGRKTKVGRKLLRFPPTQFSVEHETNNGINILIIFFVIVFNTSRYFLDGRDS